MTYLPTHLQTNHADGCDGTCDGRCLWSHIGRRKTYDWHLIEDIQESYRLAMESAGLSPSTREEIDATVGDYIANHYGDD